MKQVKAYLFVLFVLFCMGGKAQQVITNVLPEGYQRATLEGNDTIAVVPLSEIVVFPEILWHPIHGANALLSKEGHAHHLLKAAGPSH